ncbi:hypothetical protein PT974_10916 [Cladobotryum mycophilum]|uniref:Uncharacterized protein n=1 Tax=Cladobotryum mycophilum TaxID=491253 RepID=A0ABR0SB60_9HYPO
MALNNLENSDHSPPWVGNTEFICEQQLVEEDGNSTSRSGHRLQSMEGQTALETNPLSPAEVKLFGRSSFGRGSPGIGLPTSSIDPPKRIRRATLMVIEECETRIATLNADLKNNNKNSTCSCNKTTMVGLKSQITDSPSANDLNYTKIFEKYLRNIIYQHAIIFTANFAWYRDISAMYIQVHEDHFALDCEMSKIVGIESAQADAAR